MNIKDIVLTPNEQRMLKKIRRGRVCGADVVADALCAAGLAQPCLNAAGKKLSVYRLTPDGERYIVYHHAETADRRLTRFLSIAALFVSIASLLIAALSLLQAMLQ